MCDESPILEGTMLRWLDSGHSWWIVNPSAMAISEMWHRQQHTVVIIFLISQMHADDWGYVMCYSVIICRYETICRFKWLLRKMTVVERTYTHTPTMGPPKAPCQTRRNNHNSVAQLVVKPTLNTNQQWLAEWLAMLQGPMVHLLIMVWLSNGVDKDHHQPP